MDRRRRGALAVAAALGLGACSPLPSSGDYDEGLGEAVPVEVIAAGWETDFPVDGQVCAGDLCCRMGVVEVADDQAALEGIFERLFEGSRRAPDVGETSQELILVVSNQACEGDERVYHDDGATHLGPDLQWSLTFDTGDRFVEGPGRSFLVARTAKRRYRSVLPDIDVTFSGGEAE